MKTPILTRVTVIALAILLSKGSVQAERATFASPTIRSAQRGGVVRTGYEDVSSSIRDGIRRSEIALCSFGCSDGSCSDDGCSAVDGCTEFEISEGNCTASGGGCSGGSCFGGGGGCFSGCGEGGMCSGDAWSLWGTLTQGCDTPWTIGGWVQAGYHNRANGLFNNHPDRFNVHQTWLYAERAADPSKNGIDWGFRADVVYGVDAADTQAFGNNPGTWDFDNGFDHGIY
ncbi:MAG: outer membrane beta-barrel protein, partial [Planctomycetota bacterium]